MLLDFFDRKIRESFSRAAVEYDLLTGLHKEIGRELSRKVINHDHVDTILDIGMGTGWLTNRIRFFLPDSNVIGLDFAPGMTAVAKKKWEDLKIIQAHAARMPFPNDVTDIVISNLAYQWVEDLPGAFGEVYRVLKPGGKVFITLFGERTFYELFESLEKTKDGASTGTIRRLAGKAAVQEALTYLGFKEIHLREEYIKAHFPNMFGLLKWIKHIGANVLPAKSPTGKNWLQRADHYYEEHFADRFGITTTFEVLWVEAVK